MHACPELLQYRKQQMASKCKKICECMCGCDKAIDTNNVYTLLAEADTTRIVNTQHKQRNRHQLSVQISDLDVRQR